MATSTDTSFRAFWAQSPYAGLGRQNARLLPVNAALAVAALLGRAP